MRTDLVKVCGITLYEDFEELARLGVDFAGIIFYPLSPRYAVGKLDSDKVRNIKSIQKVGVFVNAPIEDVHEKIEIYGLDYVQLHGEETPEYCALVKERAKLIKAFRLESEKELEQLKAYEAVCDMFLFDTYSKVYGGSGIQFDWSILSNYDSDIPFLLSGGIGLDSIESYKNTVFKNCIGLDINSKVEIQAGIKNMNLIKELLCHLGTN